MKHVQILLALAVLVFTVTASGQSTKRTADRSVSQAQSLQQLPAPQVVELKASDSTVLNASYFAAVKPGPGVLLLHQSNRTRKAWDELTRKLRRPESTPLPSTCADLAKAAATANLIID